MISLYILKKTCTLLQKTCCTYSNAIAIPDAFPMHLQEALQTLWFMVMRTLMLEINALDFHPTSF